MRSKEIFSGLAIFTLVLGSAVAQDAPAKTKPASAPAATTGLQTGPATVVTHWSRNKYPTSIPEGATYYIVEKNDTLWDLSKRFLNNPYLWPQIWDQNKYITDAHWIYPGDPLVLPKVALVAEKAGEAGGPGGETGPGAGEKAGAGEKGGAGGRGQGPVLVPITEEMTLQCADYVVSNHEDESLRIIGNEQGVAKIAQTTNDIVYLNKGSNAGLKAGEVYTIHQVGYSVKHPVTGSTIGTKIHTRGWARVIVVQEKSAAAVIEQACYDILEDSYLKPQEKVNVPLILTRPPATRTTPPSGKLHQYIVDIAEDVATAAEGQFVTIDAGTEAGVAPGNIFTVYRIVYPNVPTPRAILGELAVVAVRDRTATAKVTYSNDAMVVGDEVELR
ncbi:MAG TPA: LysM peptidoglycan-binding domain-containing protein [Vicinamibacteria bacterium]|nr:LysM peptidoglycan-binding domain-containing protein [Vicinamibacteria bacterium]